MSRITIDPVTRIEGHLRVDVEVERGRVSRAWSSGQMFRGVETILRGRDPRDAWLFTQRFCGVCTTVHAIASVRAVENAIDLQIPPNAQEIRNLILCAHALHDHIVHFYHLSALDWVDVTSALKADPVAASTLAGTLSDWPDGRRSLKETQDKLKAFVSSGQLGIFNGGYWGHPAMRLPPEVNLLATCHYLQALDWQRRPNQVVAILGGKTPNIQNLAVGGVANAINLDEQTALNMEKLYRVRSLLEETRSFVHQVYLNDVCAIAALYSDWLGFGAGVTDTLSVPDLPLNAGGSRFNVPGGTIIDGEYRNIASFDDPWFRDNVSESIARSWYEGDWERHPWQGETVPASPDFDPEGAYSWVKSPRFQGRPMQVGPLAQVLAADAAGHEPTRLWLERGLAKASAIAGRQLPKSGLHSTLGRHLARAVRACVLSDLALEHWQRLADNIAGGDTTVCNPPTFPKGAVQGFGFHEAPRGALSHWVVIEDGRIANYQAVVPSTWNAGPRDGRGKPGPYEASLEGNPIADEERPLEVLRTIHSFDPCLACAIHAHDARGTERATVRAL